MQFLNPGNAAQAIKSRAQTSHIKAGSPRKVSLGSQSQDGERFAERALSAAATCRLQRRSLFTYLSDLITAHNRGDPFPALT